MGKLPIISIQEIPKNRMREIFTYGTVGGAGGNPGSYPEAYPDLLGVFRRSGESNTIEGTSSGEPGR
jgi:hypothetical protein